MVNYQDPAVVLQDAWVASKIWHAVAGLYFWEFATTLDYEWNIIRRHRPFRWTVWVRVNALFLLGFAAQILSRAVWQIYSTTRISTLVAVILVLVGVDVTVPSNCVLETMFQLLFGYLAISSASFLIVLRILAIWNRKKIITAIAASAWGINIIIQIQTVARIRATWVPAVATCIVNNLHITELSIIVTLVTDIILLLIMIFGLLRLGCHERGAFGLGRLLWKQGVIWLLVAVVAETLPAVFLCLDLNGPLNYTFLPPSMVALSIAATRIHRSLADHAFGTNLSGGLDSSERSGRVERKADRAPIALSRIAVGINKTFDQDQTLQKSQNGSPVYIEGQLCKKLGQQRKLDESAETDVES